MSSSCSSSCSGYPSSSQGSYGGDCAPVTPPDPGEGSSDEICPKCLTSCTKEPVNYGSASSYYCETRDKAHLIVRYTQTERCAYNGNPNAVVKVYSMATDYKTRTVTQANVVLEAKGEPTCSDA